MAAKKSEEVYVFCDVPGCGRRVETGGVKGAAPKCAGHYKRLRRNPGITAADLARPLGVPGSGEKLKPVTFRPSHGQLKALTKIYGEAVRGKGPYPSASFGEIVSRLVGLGLDALRAEGKVR